MDTNNKTRDVDALLQKALKSSHKPDAALLQSVKHELTKKERTVLNKPKTKRPIRKLAAAIAATLALTTTVFAATAYLGSFDRLRAIVGNERAEVLQPIEISLSSNETTPEAQYTPYETDNSPPEVQVSNNLAEAGIKAELVAVGVFDNVVDIYITLQDLTGNRLDDFFQVGHIVAPVNDDGIAVLSLTPEIINRSTDGVVTIRSREIFTHSVAGMQLSYTLNRINYNISAPSLRPVFYDMGIDFTTFTPQPSVLFRPDASPARSGSGIWSAAMHDEFEERLITEGFPVLQPHLHDIAVDIGGETIIISSMGIVENRLHVQIYNPTPYTQQPAAFMFYNYYELNSLTMSFGFSKDDQGNLIRAEVGPFYSEAVQYREFIFLDVDFDRLYAYRMRAGSFNPSFDQLYLNWSVTFDVAVNDMQIVAAGLDVQYESATITEIRVTPFLIQMVLDGEAEAGLDAPQIAIHTTNGVVYPASGMSFGGFGMGNFFFDMGDSQLDLDTVIFIEIGGVEVRF